METNIKSTRNFEDVQKAHCIFLANVMSQTFLLGNATERKNPVCYIFINSNNFIIFYLFIYYINIFDRLIN